MSVCLSAGSLPLWVFSMGRFLTENTSAIHQSLCYFAMWLTIAAAAHLLGIGVRWASEKTADAYLNWFAKPFLLLYSILFVTIGVYVNNYIFSLLTSPVLLSSILLPVCGYLAGNIVSYLSHQENGHMKTISAESTMSNCLLVLVIIRFSLVQPESDIASCLPFFVLFASPVPFIVNLVLERLKSSVGRHCEKRRERQSRHLSIVSSLLTVTNVTTLSTGTTSPRVCSPEDTEKSIVPENPAVPVNTEAGDFDEKITVL